MQSMCKNPYTARWPHFHVCPNLLKQPNQTNTTTDIDWNTVTVKYGAGSDEYISLVHLWLEWYRLYIKDANYPVLIIRLEDLVFYTQETIQKVCECAGGQLHANFSYVLESAKADSPGHDTSTGLTQAWIKYSRPLQVRAGFVESDYRAALQVLQQDQDHLMQRLGYHHPPSSSQVGE